MVKKIKKLILSYDCFGASDAMWLRLLFVIEKAVTGGGPLPSYVLEYDESQSLPSRFSDAIDH